MRILVAGGPRTGKTSFAEELGKGLNLGVRHTDDLIGAYAWSAASSEVATWLEEPGPWIIEGVARRRPRAPQVAREPRDRRALRGPVLGPDSEGPALTRSARDGARLPHDLVEHP